MIVSGAPLTALADEPITQLSGHYEDPVDPDCSFDWTYTEESETLFLDGKVIESRDIFDGDGEYAFHHLPLWFEYEGEEVFFEFPYTNIVFSKNVEELGTYCLGDDLLDKRTLTVSFEEGSKLSRIGSYAFSYYNISDLTFPDSVKKIDNHACCNSSFNSVTLPSRLTTFSTSVFSGSYIGNFDFGNPNITTIPSGTFEGAELNNFEIPEHITIIEKGAFRYATFNKDLVIPETVQRIGQKAFQYANFQRIVFESQIPEINVLAFANSKTAKLSTYTYIYDEVDYAPDAFTGSQIHLTVIEPVEPIDFDQHSVSGYYEDPESSILNLNWEYNAETDTLYLDAQAVGALELGDYYCLPLYYKDEAGNEILWHGTYHNIVFSKNVIALGGTCLGITEWGAYDKVSVTFEKNSNLHIIGDYAFPEAKMDSLIIPDTCCYIGEGAFAYGEIDYIKMPAFQGNEIYDELQLGKETFYECQNLEIDFNNVKLEAIPELAFFGATIKDITLPESLGSIYLEAFVKAKFEKDLYIPDNVDFIFSSAFQNASVKNVYLPESLSRIDDSAFFGAKIEGNLIFNENSGDIEIGAQAFASSDIKTFSISPNIVKIENRAFEDCKSLTRVTADANSKITAFSDKTFIGCTNLKSVDIPDSVKTIGESAFENCTLLYNISFGSNPTLETISKNAFWSCGFIKSFNFPDSVKYINLCAFNGCDRLKDISFTENSSLKAIGNSAFYDTALEEVELPDSIESIGDWCFSHCSQLTSIDLPDSITSIPAYAFSECPKLDYSIPETVKSVGNYAFSNCTNIKSVPQTVISIGEYAFQNTGITSLDYSGAQESVVIKDYAFKDCASLTRVDLSGAEITFMTGAFSNCDCLDNVVLPEDLTEIPSSAFHETAIESITIPNTVESIGSAAFSCTPLKSISIPAGVTSIAYKAFSHCTNLESVIIAPHSTEYTLGSNCFEYCTSLLRAVLPEGLSTVPTYCFAGSALEQVYLPESLTLIDDYAFNTACLYQLQIPDNVERIGKYAFNNNNNLTSFNVGKNAKLAYIDNYAFYGCGNLLNASLGNALINVGSYAFYNSKLNTVRLPKTCAYVQTNAFATNYKKCYLEKVIILCNNPKSIANNAFFYNNSSNIYYSDSTVIYGYADTLAETYASKHNINFVPLNSIENPDEIENFDDIAEEIDSAFGRWSGGEWSIGVQDIRTLYISGNGEIETETFTNSDGEEKSIFEIIEEFEVEMIYIGNEITAIPDNFLYNENGCDISYVRLPNGLKSIGAYAFANTSVKSIFNASRQAEVKAGAELCYIPQGVTSIGEYAFANTDMLTGDFILPKELTEISEGLFFNSSVPHVEMFGKVKKIGKKAFAECYNMTTLYVPLSVTDIYSDGNVDNSAFGYVDSKPNSNLWVNTRNGSAAAEYCTENGIIFANVLGLPYRSGKFTSYGGANTTNTSDAINWQYYAEDKQLVISANNSNNIIVSNWQRFYEYDSDSKTTALVRTLTSESDLAYINLNPDKILFDRILEFDAGDLMSVLNPKEVEFNSFMRRVGQRTFANCKRLEKAELPSSVSYVGAYCFENCTSLKQVRLGYGITVVSEGLFSECRSLESVDLGNVILQSIGDKAFYNCNALKFVNLKNQTSYTNGSIGAQAFYNCVNLQEIFIPDNIRYIEPKAFYNCVQVQKLTLSGNVTRIEKDAFANLFYCEEININSEVNPAAFSNEKDMFANLGAYTNGIELNVGSAVENLNCEFFKDLKITKINLGSGVNALSNKQYLSALEEITADENETFSVKNGLLYRGSTLVLAPQGLTQISVDGSTNAIESYAFYGTNAKSIALPDSVEAIGESCFENSKALVGITLSEGLTAIPENAFKNCTKLRLLNLPENIVLIKESAFEGCTSLVSAVFNNSLYSIGKNAFKDCSRLEGLAFPENLSSIQEGAFMNCAGLKYAYIWRAQIGANAFSGCDKLNIFTPVGTDAYRYAREFDIPYSAYIDEELFFDEWAIKIDALAGYLGYCEEDGHGDIEYLTVYEADCEHDGYVIGVCEYCSEILEEIHIDAYGHNYKTETEIPATATTRGITVYTCENCNQSFTTYSAPLDENFEVENHSVSGKIELSANRYANQGLAPARGASIVIDDMTVATSDENGDFSFEIETGTYEAHIKYAYGFTRTIYIQVRNEDIECDNPIVIIGCDFSKDGQIDDEDVKLFSMIISAKQNDPSYLRFVDMNGDGYINAKDMLYINACKGITSQNFKYPQFIIS